MLDWKLFVDAQISDLHRGMKTTLVELSEEEFGSLIIYLFRIKNQVMWYMSEATRWMKKKTFNFSRGKK